jgi:arylformamidase
LEHFAELKGLVIRKPFQENIALDSDLFKDLEIEGKALLIQTGWDIHWNTDKYYNNHPF